MALKWFADNFMKLNADKCHLLVLGQRCDDSVTVKIGNTDVVNSSQSHIFGRGKKGCGQGKEGAKACDQDEGSQKVAEPGG